ncbi:MBL fold metallo-hydrolase [Candidatus Bathyarchaeota archaeon]|nr:MBL fold metallo-hydrolase [Candidatus Bathyarchaeota archaeon]
MLSILGDFHPLLKNIYLIQGVGLCSNIYVINKGKLTLIDCGNGLTVNSIKIYLDKLSIKNVEQVILTHGHPDHTGGLREVLRYFKPKIFIHKLDFNLPFLTDKSLVTFVENNDEISIGDGKLNILHTPGHTAGSICLYEKENKILFSGDTVFPGGFFGRTDLPTGDSQSLIKSLKKLTELDVDFLLAGHEEPVFRNAKKHITSSFKAALSFFNEFNYL